MPGRVEVENKIEQGIEKKLDKYPPFVAEWYYSLRAKGNTVRSCREYLNKLEYFLEVMDYDLIDLDVDDITSNDLTKFFTVIQYKQDDNGNKIKTSGAYLNSMWFALNNFFEYQYELGRIDKNYMQIVKPAKNKMNIVGKQKPLLTTNDFKRMLCNIPGESSVIKQRNKAILLVFMTTGMRRAALCQIDIADVDFVKHTIKVIDKGEIEHTFKMNDAVETAIKDWLKLRNYVNNLESDALFVTYQGKRITGNAVFNMINYCSEKALGQSISPHRLRSGLCSILYEETHDIEFVRRAIGHKNIATTQKYIITDGNEKEEASRIMANLL
jgi:site-specific recombinase XerD